MILITGGGGFLGKNIARYLVDQGEEVLLLDNRPIQVPSFLAPFWDTQVKGAAGDLLDLPCLFSLIERYSIDSIIHAAVIAAGEPYRVLKVNIEGTANVLEASRIFGLRRVSFTSSATVYSGIETSLYDEDIDLPVTSETSRADTRFVPATKKAGEQICLLYAREYGLSVLILRISRGYGPLSHRGGNPIDVMVESAVAQKVADLSHIYGERKSDNIYVKDLAKAVGLIHLAEAPKHSIYNIGDGIARSWSEFAEAVRKAIPDAKINLGTVRSAKDFDTPPLDMERIKQEVGFIPEYDLERILKDYVDWLREGKY